MPQEIDKVRLDKVLEVINEAGIRFPVAEVAKQLNKDKGMVSAYLSGKKPISDNFYSSFMSHFKPKKVSNIEIREADVGKEISKLIEITIKQQAAINLLMKAFDSVSAKAVEKEYERLYDEWSKPQG